MNGRRKEYTFTWFIENYTYCSHKNGEVLRSPEFTVDGLEGTVWCLKVYPRGQADEYKGSISLYLNRSNADNGPKDFPLKYELSALSKDGVTLCSEECEYTFKKGIGYGYHKFLKMNEILMHGKTVYFPEDNFILRCKMWRGKGNSVTQISARTRIGIEQIVFLHVVKGFSTLETNQKKTIRIRSPSEKGLALSCALYFTDGPFCQEKIMVEIMPSKTDQILSKCKLSLLDGSRKKIECSAADNRFNATQKDIQILPLYFLRQEILNRKHEYLPDDKLFLSCECIFSAGVEYEKIEKTVYEKPFVALNQINDNDQENDTFVEKFSNSNSALDDFKEIYLNQFLTDMEIKTKTKSFPTHKIVLCARSPVFKAMMTNHMKEKNSNIIQVDEIEDHIVQKLLLFLYSDNLETPHWESANKLYYAADKYAIEKLKVICSSFLIDNLSTSTASELLLLADTHNDSRLKKAVEDFIFKHERQVYGSDEWKNLIETNPRLVSKTMLLMHERKL